MKKFVFLMGILIIGTFAQAEKLTWKIPEDCIQSNAKSQGSMMQFAKEMGKSLLFVYEYKDFTEFRDNQFELFWSYYEDDYNRDDDLVFNMIKSGNYEISKYDLMTKHTDYTKIFLNNEIVGNYVFELYVEGHQKDPFGKFVAIFAIGEKIYKMVYYIKEKFNEYGEPLNDYFDISDTVYNDSKSYSWKTFDSIKQFANKIQAKDESLPAEILKYIEDWEGIIGSLEIVK